MALDPYLSSLQDVMSLCLSQSLCLSVSLSLSLALDVMLYLAASPVLRTEERSGARAREIEREKEREKGREREREKERETETEILKSEGQSESVLYVSVCARHIQHTLVC